MSPTVCDPSPPLPSPRLSQDHDRSGYFVITELCDGGDLAKLYKKPHFNKAEYVRVVSEILSGLAYLHHRVISHRDLKPENVSAPCSLHRVRLGRSGRAYFCWGAQILLTSAMKVKIADFGLAKYQQITSTTGVGTPAYMVRKLNLPAPINASG